jgi:exopolyphosphatase / guanosine-5'-triphosphate,3'-diphosphate pyrophosphatase
MIATKKRLALIDLGTNTFHLLITEVAPGEEPNNLVKIKEPVKLGEGGISRGEIAPAAYERALTTLTFFRELIDQYRVTDIRAMATSAVRVAANGAQLVRDIAEQTGISVEVISGDQEAELIYQGVRSAMELGTEKSLIIDIGGGSIEFILCDDETIYWKNSFEIGAQRLLDKFYITDPMEEHAIEAEKQYLEEQLTSLAEAIDQYKPCTLIGSSGTFDTLCDINSLKNGIDRQLDSCPEDELSLSCFYEMYEEILRKNREERLAIPGMLEMRVDMIVVAIILIDYILENYAMNRIRVSAYALKEGMLRQLLQSQ